MKTIKQTYLINSSLEEVWRALTDPKYIDAWGGGPAKIDDKKGTKFEFWGGDIHGKNIEKGWKEYYLEPLKEYLENK